MESTLLAALASGFLLGAGSVAIGWSVYKRHRSLPTLKPDTVRVPAHILDQAGIGSYFWDMKKDQLHWSDHYCVLFGLPPGSTVTYEMFRERIHPDDLPAVEDAIAGASRDHAHYQLCHRLRLDDATVRWVNSSGRFVYDGQDKPVGMNGVVIDMTQAMEAESARLERESELKVLIENLPDIISRFDRQRRFLFISSKIEELTGVPASFFIGKKHEELGTDPVLAMRWQATLENVIRNKCATEFDISYDNQHGERRFFITRAVPLFDSEGEVAMVLAISSDHTERELNAQRMRDIGESLKKADERKNQYLATLAHELRGPLAPIASAAQLIKLSSDSTVREKAREVIERQTASLSALVDDLMEVGRISEGKLDIKKERITVRSVIDQAVESVRPLLDAKSQPLAFKLSDEPIWLDGDPLRLTQVFVNLLTNASKYSPADTRISLEAGIDSGNAVIRVRDQGIGLTDAQMLEIFDIFVQVHSIGVQAQGGLGIGLSVVKQLVELHKGTVTVSSEGVNKGSCFTVVLPLAEQQMQVRTSALPESPGAAPLTILIVDDSVDGATTLASLLESLGHRAITAFTGNDAVKLAAEHPVDMAFVDLSLPDISGIQVALRIRHTENGHMLPLFALTGLGRDEDHFLTRAAQFNEHLIKPLGIADLNRITAEVAKKKAGRAERST